VKNEVPIKQENPKPERVKRIGNRIIPPGGWELYSNENLYKMCILVMLNPEAGHFGEAFWRYFLFFLTPSFISLY